MSVQSGNSHIFQYNLNMLINYFLPFVYSVLAFLDPNWMLVHLHESSYFFSFIFLSIFLSFFFCLLLYLVFCSIIFQMLQFSFRLLRPYFTRADFVVFCLFVSWNFFYMASCSCFMDAAVFYFSEINEDFSTWSFFSKLQLLLHICQRRCWGNCNFYHLF